MVRNFWAELWCRRPRARCPAGPPAGRVAFSYLPGYLGGSLLCTLPSGRVLTYRNIRWEGVPTLDDDGSRPARRSRVDASRVATAG